MGIFLNFRGEHKQKSSKTTTYRSMLDLRMVVSIYEFHTVFPSPKKSDKQKKQNTRLIIRQGTIVILLAILGGKTLGFAKKLKCFAKSSIQRYSSLELELETSMFQMDGNGCLVISNQAFFYVKIW